MHLESKHVIDQPADVVYPLVRDDIKTIVPYLPNVRRIDTVKHERTSDTRVEVVNHWFAIAEVPSAIRKIIKPEFFSWKDTALWKDDERCVDYRLESFLAADLYDARGTNYFTPVGDDRTELRVTCDIQIHADRIPGVPNFVLKRTLPIFEQLLSALLAPNLRSVGRGLSKYFAASARR